MAESEANKASLGERTERILKTLTKVRKDIINEEGIKERSLAMFDNFRHKITEILTAEEPKRTQLQEALAEEHYVEAQNVGKTGAEEMSKFKEEIKNLRTELAEKEDEMSEINELLNKTDKQLKEYMQLLGKAKQDLELLSKKYTKERARWSIIEVDFDTLKRSYNELLERERSESESDIVETSNEGPQRHKNKSNDEKERSTGKLWLSAPKLKESAQVETWLDKMEVFKRVNKLSDDEMKDGTLIISGDPVFRYAKLLNERQPNLTWKQFGEELKKRFAATDRFQLRLELFERKQGSREKLLAYIESKLDLCRRVDVDMSESEQVAIIQRGLTERYSGLAITKFTSLSDFMDAAKTAATWFERSERPWIRRNVPINNINLVPRSEMPKQVSPNMKRRVGSRTWTNSGTFRKSPPRSPKTPEELSSKKKKRIKPTPRKNKLPLPISSYFINGNIPGVEGFINGHSINVVLDTGCGAILMSRKCARRCHLKVHKTKRNGPNFIGPSGERLKILGEAKCIINLMGNKIQIRVSVISKLATDVLLGTTFFDKHKAEIDFVNRKLSLNIGVENDLTRMSIPFVESKPINLVTEESVVIPPFAEVAVKVSSDRKISARNSILLGRKIRVHNGAVGCLNGIICGTILNKVVMVNLTWNVAEIGKGRKVASVEEMDYIDTRNSWEKLLPYAVFAYNTAVHDATKFSPFELIHGREPLVPTDILLSRKELRNVSEEDICNTMIRRLERMRDEARKHLERSQQKQLKTLCKRKTPIVFQKGQLVLLNTPISGRGKKSAFDYRYHGPYRVLMQLNPNNYEVEEVEADVNGNKFRGVVHIKYMKPYISPTHAISNDPIESEEESEFENSRDKDYKPNARITQKKRGRPRKNVPKEVQEVPKRKRGRPRKSCQFAE
ncbi:hypothetical protein B4U79_16705 [Dinothrombium tinctorium]|uniref:Retrotransposon gag domain-containing protein n=1 Tax=Dinothrombium tinctorium TaxID=1965070 RepID=A0A3S3RJ06_9ACAR|nr:hypothetical protein B4U79_16705 [Dinothrombium tinctorium]